MSGSQQCTRTRTLWREGGGLLGGEERGWHHSPRQEPSRGRGGGGGGVDDDFSGVEISIAGGVEKMVRA